jgi:predicted nucleic acid-binding protein
LKASNDINGKYEKLSRLAGELKCRGRGELSLVDACILAVAIVKRATLVACDSRVSELNLVPMHLLEPL